MINNVVLVGRITKDVESKAVGENVCVNFSIAVQRDFKNKSTGEYEADFINCVAWNNTAKFLINYVKKGNLIGVQGRIQTRSYQNNDNQTVYVTEIICNNVQNLTPKNTVASAVKDATPVADNTEVDITDADIPF